MSNIKLPWRKKTMEEKKAKDPYGGYNTLAELQESWADKELDRDLATLERLNGGKEMLEEKFSEEGIGRYSATQIFADRWIDIFTEVPSDANILFEGFMGEDCRALNFEMDCGKAFTETYGNDRLLFSLEDFSALIDRVTDVDLLGSAIFSNWRRITHWSYESGFSDENKAWFLLALNRLKDLTK